MSSASRKSSARKSTSRKSSARNSKPRKSSARKSKPRKSSVRNSKPRKSSARNSVDEYSASEMERFETDNQPFWKQKNPWKRAWGGLALISSSALFGFLAYRSYKDYQKERRPLDDKEMSELGSMYAMNPLQITDKYGQEWNEKFKAFCQLVNFKHPEDLQGQEAFEWRTFYRELQKSKKTPWNTKHEPEPKPETKPKQASAKREQKSDPEYLQGQEAFEWRPFYRELQKNQRTLLKKTSKPSK